MSEFRNLFVMGPTNRPKALVSLIVTASAAIVGLMSVSIARDDSGMREFFLQQASPRPYAAPEADVPAPSRSLTIRPTLHEGKVASAGKRSRQRVARVAKPSRPAAATPRLAAFAPSPGRPLVVSIYEDQTLRRGDAVMTMKGLRIFAGSRTFPYRPEDFTPLPRTRGLINRELRRALIEFDQNPLLRG